MTPTLSRRALSLLGAGLLARPALAQPAWPQRQVTLVVPYPPGGSTDNVARPLMVLSVIGPSPVPAITISLGCGGTSNSRAVSVTVSAALGVSVTIESTK